MPVASMTGYGKSEVTLTVPIPSELSVEIKSLNSRFLEIAVSASPRYNGLELAIRNVVQEFFARGRIAVHIRRQAAPTDRADDFELRLHRARGKLEAVHAFPDAPAERQKALFTLALSTLSGGRESDDEDIPVGADEESALIGLVREACRSVRTSRAREGEKIASAIDSFVRQIDAGVSSIRSAAADLQKLFEDRLRKRIAAKIHELAHDDPRLALELVLQVERADCREEIDRLTMHCGEFTRLLHGCERRCYGKEFDFLAQEMARETSTLATKVQGTNLAEPARQLRLVVEQIREQIQNVE